MNFPPILFLFLALFAPLVVLVVVGRIKLRTRRRKAQAIGEVPAKLFEPAAEPALGIFLRRFTLPERTYLREQRAIAKSGYFICAWILLVFSTSSLLPQRVGNLDAALTPPQRAWFSYLNNFEFVAIVAGFLTFITVIVAVASLQSTRQAIFFRTRPLTCRFLFWARMIPALSTLLASVVSSLLLSMLFALIFYGSFRTPFTGGVTHFVFTSPSGPQHIARLALGNWQTYIRTLILLYQSSLSRLVLSMLTTTMLAFSVLLVFVALPFQSPFKINSKSVSPLLTFFSVFGFLLAKSYIAKHFSHSVPGGNSGLSFTASMFFYFSPGHPPPWICSLVPVLLSVALLWLAQIFLARKEI